MLDGQFQVNSKHKLDNNVFKELEEGEQRPNGSMESKAARTAVRMPELLMLIHFYIIFVILFYNVIQF